MRNEIWATLFHKLSTDENPQHDKCSESWCNWKKAQAANSLDTFHHKSPLSQEVFKAIKPIYEELSREELLNRCLGGYTQNSNESFNAAVWNLALKSYSSGNKVLNIATDIAVCVFNDGVTNILQIMKVMEMDIDAAKKARSNLKSARKQTEEENLNLEGQLYLRIAD
ncbi:uncharacterized protein LOC112588116 [Harpegnathos saltator]|uniref:uncharacterized protein LOC112588116 n=1 Tax=Harpegnathos saltator TaxID=610380 RepID=UPI000DBEE2AB|nr:uncharacterized protein LOC112588116 [Harpegnathos saltator]